MTESTKSSISNASLVSGVGLFGAGSLLELPTEMADFSEPVGLILAFIGAAMKLIQYVRARAK